MAAFSSSGSDSSSSRSTSPEPDNKQKQTLKGASKAKDDAEDSDSTDSSDSSDSSSSDDSSSDEMDTSEDVSQTKKVTSSGSKTYKAPSGFKPANKQAAPSSSSSSLLSDLRGKQIYHISAPASLPLSKVKEISMSKIMKGEPILEFDGVKYGIPAESITEEGSEGKKLLVYDESTQTYVNKSDNVPSYQIQEMFNLPGSVGGGLTAVEALRDTVKPARPQPKKLRMRFRPVGSLPSAPETLGSSSDEEKRKRKHHHTEGDATQATGLPRKKSKKLSAQEDVPPAEESKKSKKSSKDREEKKRKKSSKA
ncbi:hypothetical protein N7509_008686 [Penicillium cosmopolitanum]|uniref:DNA-directed RNA polymerase I subunit RPA34.5 n=1 Tax=Penicillium cosmopolitanum TaxID=1131564 RepID=A0A9W9VN34_9EURO|nr:uncharacterized protein N7509_008686 [Penicillium cosmopolitanum]KAJ5386145.1 hypothetical protein N7509_008686 [Penicillium cosmopolitanum]